MVRLLALLICTAFVLYLFRADREDGKRHSKALWIPLIWIFFGGTREFSQWLYLGGQYASPDAVLEGNTMDLVVQSCLIVGGIVIVKRRHQDWGEWLSRNRMIWLYFLFGLISVVWSDYPFVSFKRWIKATGNLVMALVVLTEERPYEVLGDVLRRFAFLVIPFSVLACRFYPEIGRMSEHRGTFLYNGLAMGKNGLGQLCLIAGIYFLWNLLHGSRDQTRFASRSHRWVSFLFLAMIAYLLKLANSATSLGCLFLVLGVLLVTRMPAVSRHPKRILPVGIFGLAFVWLFETTFKVKELALSFLHRSSDLTTRIPMWNDLLSMVSNPILGVGYESFWLGDRMILLWDKGYRFLQSHNGYLETYLNLGLIGLSFIVGSILSGLLQVNRQLTTDFPAAILRLAIILTVVVYNWTEATFYGISNIWILFLMAAIDVHVQETVSALHGVQFAAVGKSSSHQQFPLDFR